jgi:hypothetical protein
MARRAESLLQPMAAKEMPTRVQLMITPVFGHAPRPAQIAACSVQGVGKVLEG